MWEFTPLDIRDSHRCLCARVYLGPGSFMLLRYLSNKHTDVFSKLTKYLDDFILVQSNSAAHLLINMS